MHKGYVGVDKAGSVSHFPMVIASVYSNEHKKFLDIMKEVREIASREKKIFLSVKEIKSRDIKKTNIQKEILECITKNLEFNCVVLNNKPFGEIKNLVIKRKDYMKKLEAIFWYKSIAKFCKNENAIPKKVYLDLNYTKDKDLRFFEENILLLFNKFHENSPSLISVNSKDYVCVGLSDLVAGILMRNRELMSSYKNKISILSKREVENEVKFLFKM